MIYNPHIITDGVTLIISRQFINLSDSLLNCIIMHTFNLYLQWTMDILDQASSLGIVTSICGSNMNFSGC